ncbi:MAG: hypothetical protein GXP40_02120 [Chloroflexi bacterium]|nr:hypothetical protein [Chloroflexota bacterium]
MPPIVYDIFELLGVLVRLVGMLVFGLGVGWFTLEAFRKEAWQLQIAVFLGFVGLAIAMTRFATAGALGMFGIGAGAALLLWGRSKKEEKEEDD